MMLSYAYKKKYGNAALRNVWLFCFLLDSEYREQKEVHPILGELLLVDWALSD
ncbi:MAG TPA: hypothetical protein VKY33_04725 [Flavobacterium sp.]|nr:hypothetical protein [Flavobacterium sp.]